MILLLLLLLGSTATGQQLPCGSTPITQSRVIGGQNARPGAWPWQIALKRYGRFICGGSLISADWVVTAAHCVAGSSNPANYRIVVGEHDRNTNEGTEQEVGVQRVIKHPNYNTPSRLNNDIALMQLSTRVSLSQRVNPVCLPNHDSDIATGSTCYITGWGKIRHPGSSYHILQQAMMPPIDKTKCRQKIQAAGVSITLTPQMLCAGVHNTILSGCHGDSGGPYVCLNADGRTYTLHGAVSWGSGSCNARILYSVFARVTQFRAWIKTHTGLGGGGGGSTPPIPTTPAGNLVFSCNFNSDLCGFTQSRIDDFDWTQNSGPTSSYQTGPSQDVSGNGKYMYIETSSPRVSGDKARLEKSGLSFSTKKCLSFYYHMYGNSMGSLKVLVGSRTVFTKSGNQGNQWYNASVEITDLGASKLVFEGTRGSSYQGDAAIDNVELRECGSGGGGYVSTPSTPITATATTTPPPFICDFESPQICGFQQSRNDIFDWTRNRGRTPSYSTGPTSDHTSGNGYYMYIETSYPRKLRDYAILNSRLLTFRGNMCLRFYYHMYGSTIGSLGVRISGKNVFHKSGNQSNQWLKAEININSFTGINSITFLAKAGSSYTGDIAIDDVSLIAGTCSSITPPPPSSPPPPGSCGIRPQTRIVGGTQANPGAWPWQVMLRSSPSGSQFCGGSLVAPAWVITAAHCVARKRPSSFEVRLGAHKRTQASTGYEQDFNVSKIITHPFYHSPVRYSHDIALLKLSRPAALNRRVNLVCLPNAVPAPIDGTRCWITGWGTLTSGGITPDNLMQASVPTVSRSRCDTAYPREIHDSMICAGLDQGGIDTCQGDSGGPMVCETGGRYYLQGVTSWGYGCARPGKFGVYAKVTYLFNWLQREMARN